MEAGSIMTDEVNNEAIFNLHAMRVSLSFDDGHSIGRVVLCTAYSS